MVRKTGKHNNHFFRHEKGVIRKSWKKRIKVALVYPNTYRAGMSSLGFQTVYRLLNSFEHVLCERAFWPSRRDSVQSRIQTIESGRNITEFDMIAFSVSFENDYLNIVKIIQKTGLPLHAVERKAPHPVLIAGGVACFLNPEPAAPFIDCFILGEAEEILPKFIKLFQPSDEKTAFLKKIAGNLPGIYVPSFYSPSYNNDGRIKSFKPANRMPKKIKCLKAKGPLGNPAHTTVLSSETAFPDTFLIETSRGCTHGCRFCSAGYVYRPQRHVSPPLLEECLGKGAEMTERAGLIGATISDLPYIENLCELAIQKDMRVSFSSLRADSLSPGFISALRKSGTKTATIAPDAGSERMRNIINKGITEDHILNAVETLVAGGIPNLKLYFMIGLPEESLDDVEAIVMLCKKIKKIFLKASRAKKRIGGITVNVNPFVPKPFTPFQWVLMNHPRTIKKKINHIRKGLKKVPNLRVHGGNPRSAYIQALISRGDRRISEVLSLAADNMGNWTKTLKNAPVDTDFFALRERKFDEHLPWDFIDNGINKSFLIKEYKKAKKGKPSAPCLVNSCGQCGACDN